MALREIRPPIPTAGIGKIEKARYEVKNTSYRAFFFLLSNLLDSQRTILSIYNFCKSAFVENAEFSKRAKFFGQSLAKVAFPIVVVAKGVKTPLPAVREGGENSWS